MAKTIRTTPKIPEKQLQKKVMVKKFSKTEELPISIQPAIDSRLSFYFKQPSMRRILNNTTFRILLV